MLYSWALIHFLSCGTPSFTPCHVSVSRWPPDGHPVSRETPGVTDASACQALCVPWPLKSHGGDLRQSKMGYDGHEKYLGLQLSKMGFDGILESNDGICRYPMTIDTENVSEKKKVMG